MCYISQYQTALSRRLLQVLCTIQLHLADENGVKLDVFRWKITPQKNQKNPKIFLENPPKNHKHNSCREVPLAASMALFEGSTCRWVEVKVKLEQADSWALTFTPPCPGIAHLSVVIGGRHVRNSPYVLHVRSLSLDPHEEMANLSSKTKKCVRFNEVSMWTITLANNMFSFLVMLHCFHNNCYKMHPCHITSCYPVLIVGKRRAAV